MYETWAGPSLALVCGRLIFLMSKLIPFPTTWDFEQTLHNTHLKAVDKILLIMSASKPSNANLCLPWWLSNFQYFEWYSTST